MTDQADIWYGGLGHPLQPVRSSAPPGMIGGPPSPNPPAYVGLRCWRPPSTSAWLAAPTALTISKMRLRTRPSRIL